MSQKNDYEDFISAEDFNPPKILSEKIFLQVAADLHPSPWSVFTKLSLLHFISALVTLSICPQFGFRLAGSGPGLMEYFMIFGHVGCFFACGTFFLGTSLLLAVLTLKTEELSTIRSHRWVQVLSLIFLSLGFFIMLQTEIVFGFAGAWIFGTIFGSMSMLELGWTLRKRWVY